MGIPILLEGFRPGDSKLESGERGSGDKNSTQHNIISTKRFSGTKFAGWQSTHVVDAKGDAG